MRVELVCSAAITDGQFVSLCAKLLERPSLLARIGFLGITPHPQQCGIEGQILRGVKGIYGIDDTAGQQDQRDSNGAENDTFHSFAVVCSLADFGTSVIEGENGNQVGS